MYKHLQRQRWNLSANRVLHTLDSQVACELEMWGEAFRSVEDIQSLIMLSKRTPNHKFMATYYARLTQIFAGEQGLLQHYYCSMQGVQCGSSMQGVIVGATAWLRLNQPCCLIVVCSGWV
jgi:hypothetical protein